MPTRRSVVVVLLLVTAATATVGVAAGAEPVARDGSDAATDAHSHPSDDTRSCSFPVSHTDATGTEVTVASEPSRVVTLAPSAAQTMWEIGAREKVVGVSQYASYLEGAGDRTNVSAAGGAISVETVVAQDPDLVLAPNVVPNETVRALRRADLTVYRFGMARDMAAILNKTLLIGRLTGACAGAAATVATMERDLSRVERTVAGQPRPRVLYVFFGYTAGRDTFIHEIITTAGGTNVAARAGIAGYRRISDEVVVQQDPEWIVVNSDGPRVPRNDAYNSTTAVERDRIVVVNADYISQPAPRTVRTVRKLARTFHPDAYAAANRTPTDTSTAPGTPTPTPARSPSPSPTPAGTQGSAPGFTLAVAVLALLALGVGYRRG